MEPRRLAQYVRLCRKLGVKSLTVGDVAFEVDLAFEPASKQTLPEVKESSPQIEELSPEELLFWSATGSV